MDQLAKNKMTDNNWSSHCYRRGELLAFISIGGQFDPNKEAWDEVLCYYVTVSNQDFVEQFQEEFEDLQTALNQLNQRYSSWDLTIRGQATGSGCSSCAAH